MDWLQSAIHTFTQLAHQWRLDRQSRFQARYFSFLINQNLHRKELDPMANDVLTAGNTNPNNKPFSIFQPVRQNNLELCFVQAHFQLNECHRYLRISELCSQDPLAYPQLIVASPLLHNLITKLTLKDTQRLRRTT